MRGTALLEELLNVARRRGLTVRREAMTRGVSGGGLAVVKGVPTLFVDDRASVDAQIEIVATALRRFDWSEVFLAPAVRALLGAGRDQENGQHSDLAETSAERNSTAAAGASMESTPNKHDACAPAGARKSARKVRRRS